MAVVAQGYDKLVSCQDSRLSKRQHRQRSWWQLSHPPPSAGEAMTTNRDRGILATASAVRLPCRISPNGLTGPGVTHRGPRGSHVAVRPHPGWRLACAVTPYREGRCLLMPRYA